MQPTVAQPAPPAVRRMASSAVSRAALVDSIARAARVTVIAAPPGSGKTFLLRSWIEEAGLAERTAFVSVQREQRDAQQFWTSVVDSLRATEPGSQIVGALGAAPSFDGWAAVERLLGDLVALEERLWLVIDDLHELSSDEALRQLELLLLRAPETVRFVLATRQDLRLGLHRLRLSGELTEIRGDELRFANDEARILMDRAGVKLSDSAFTRLVERTEGWAAGLRLAALSLQRHPDPERFAAEFSGSERTVAEYLLSEVLERQTPPCRQLLLRTSILERINGPLADLLTGSSGGERILQELEGANALVVSLDSSRSWFRYHHLLTDLLRLELRRTEPAAVSKLHAAAADWYVIHGYPAEAVRHTQAAEDWPLAARRLFDHWVELVLDGRGETAHELLARFPPDRGAADPELTTLMVADELNRGSLAEAQRFLELATARLASVAPERLERFQTMRAIVRLELARQRTDVAGVIEAAELLLAPAEAHDAAQLKLGDDLRALALLSLGIAEIYGAARLDDAERHLEQCIALARRIARPYLEAHALGHAASIASFRSFPLVMERGLRAIDIARQHGWSDDPVLLNAYVSVALTTLWRGEIDDAEPWLRHAEGVLRPELDPALGLVVNVARAELEFARGHYAEAAAALRTGEQLRAMLAAPRVIADHAQGFLLQTLLKLGETNRVKAALGELDETELTRGEMRIVRAVLNLSERDPEGASVALAPVLDGTEALFHPNWQVVAFLLEAIARSSHGEASEAGRALERALDLAEPNGLLLAFMFYPAPELLERHLRSRTAHAALISQVLDRVAVRRGASAPAEPARLREPLTASETRVLRYLPTNLTLKEIGNELHLSANTVKTHVRQLYDKLDAHTRTKAVKRARELALLAPDIRRH